MKTVKLGEVCEFRRGLTYKKTDEVSMSNNIVLRANNIDLNGFQLNFSELKYISDIIEIPRNKYLEKDSIFICVASGSKSHLGKVAYIDKDYPYAFGGFMGLIVPNRETIDGKYLYKVLTSASFRNRVDTLTDGTNINNLKFKDIENFEFNLPTLEEQRRVVARLNVAFEKIDRAIELTEENIKNSHNVYKAHLKHLFDAMPDNWVSSLLNEITTKVGSGATPKGGKKSYQDHGISLVRSMNVYDTYFKYGQLAYLNNEQASKLSNVTLQSGDVLLNITGASIARCNVLPEDCLPGRVNQHVSIIRLDQSKMLPEFLHYELISEKYKKKLHGIGNGKGSTRQAITKGQIQGVRVYYPESLEKQQQLVEQVKKIIDKSKLLAEAYRKKRKDLEALKQSLLAEAFSESDVK